MAEFFQPANQLYVGNIPWTTSEGELNDLFASYGCTAVNIPTGREGRSRGYAIIDMSSSEQAAAAIANMDGQLVGDRPMTVRESKSRADRPGAEGGGGGGGGGSRGGRSATGLGAPAAANCRCYVGNLAWETTEEALIAHCTNFGLTVVQCEVARQHSGRSKGWALVDFASAEAATAAIQQLHDSELETRAMIVRLERAAGAQSSTVRVERTGGGGGGNRAPRADPRPENSSGLQIVVRSLPYSTTSEEMLAVFQQVGTVHSCNVQVHADTGRSKGWGTVKFETTEQAQAAIDGFNGVELGGRPMQIKMDRFE
jgi:RNA recognition motif-containing protein